MKTLIATLLLTVGSVAPAGVDPDWITPYQSPGSFTFYEIVADQGGNTFTVATLDDDLSVTKVSPQGVVLWQTVYAGPIGQDIGAGITMNADETAVYALGRSIVPGFGNSDFNILKVDAESGEIVWQRFYDGGTLGIDSPQDIVGTPDGGVAACGGIGTSDEQRDYGTVKLDADGEVVWESRFSGVGAFLFENDDARFLAVTPDGDIVVTGTGMGGATRADSITLKYDGTTGAEIWSSGYATPADDSVRDLKIASDGDVLLFGSDPGGADRRWFLARYDGTTGTEQWATLVDPGLDERPAAITIAPDGTIFATGSTDPDGDDSNRNENVITIAYDGETGSVLWLNEFGDEGVGDFDIGLRVHTNGAGKVYVFGYTESASLVVDPFESDALVLTIDAETGAQIGVSAIDMTAPGGPAASESIFDTAVDGRGDVYAYGAFYDGTQDLELFMRFGIGGTGCGPADVADPLGTLDLADVQAFIAGFIGMDTVADLDGNGVFDLADVQAFIGVFTTGCP